MRIVIKSGDIAGTATYENPMRAGGRTICAGKKQTDTPKYAFFAGNSQGAEWASVRENKTPICESAKFQIQNSPYRATMKKIHKTYAYPTISLIRSILISTEDKSKTYEQTGNKPMAEYEPTAADLEHDVEEASAEWREAARVIGLHTELASMYRNGSKDKRTIDLLWQKIEEGEWGLRVVGIQL